MPRKPRIIVPHAVHHVTQRGNYEQVVFESAADYEQYAVWMTEYAARYDVDILAYCLMPTHVHFLVIPHETHALARLFNTVHMRYAQYINRKRCAHGHLWQARFFSCVVDEVHMYRAMRYVEMNPVRKGLMHAAALWQWSSAARHCDAENGSQIPLPEASLEIVGRAWQEFLGEEDESMCREMRVKTQRGLVIGRRNFIQELEQQFNRSLQCLGRGRPRKEMVREPQRGVLAHL